MKMTMTKEEIGAFTQKQLDFYIPDGYVIEEKMWGGGCEKALARCDNCFKHIMIPSYRDEKKESCFSHLHRDQYATFLYFLANIIWRQHHEKQLCDKLLNLQSILHNFFLSYKCDMPDLFLLNHPMGSVIGNAKYADGLCISQNVTVNTNPDLCFGQGVYIGAGASVIGNKPIGNRVSIGTNVLIHNQSIEDDHTCICDGGKMVIRLRKSDKCFAEQIFDMDFH